jgi:hypothetical protein
MSTPGTSAVAAVMRFLLTIQAALNDATPAQRERMRKRMPPLIEKMRETGETAPIRRLIREVLGPDWQPTGDAAEWIEAMRDPG